MAMRGGCRDAREEMLMQAKETRHSYKVVVFCNG